MSATHRGEPSPTDFSKGAAEIAAQQAAGEALAIGEGAAEDGTAKAYATAAAEIAQLYRETLVPELAAYAALLSARADRLRREELWAKFGVVRLMGWLARAFGSLGTPR